MSPQLKKKKTLKWSFLWEDFLTCSSSVPTIFLCDPTAPINQHSRCSVSTEKEKKGKKDKWKNLVALHWSAAVVMLEMNVVRYYGLFINCRLPALPQPSPSGSFPWVQSGKLGTVSWLIHTGRKLELWTVHETLRISHIVFNHLRWWCLGSLRPHQANLIIFISVNTIPAFEFLLFSLQKVTYGKRCQVWLSQPVCGKGFGKFSFLADLLLPVLLPTLGRDLGL